MSETAELKKHFIIEVDMLTGAVTYDNKDDLTFTEALGVIEYTKLMITKQFLDGCES